MRKRLLSGLFLACLSAAVAGLSATSAAAQVRAGEGTRPSGAASATVSVASLGVSSGAREHYRLAIVANTAHREDECDREITKALQASPNFAEVYLLRAMVEVNRHTYDAAVADVLTAQRLDAGLAWEPVALAEAYNGLCRYQDALLVLQNLRGSIFASWQVKYEMARAEVGLKRAEEAIYWSSEALAVSPKSFSDGHLLYANALQLSSRWSEAVRELKLYLASPGPEAKRAEVVSALAFADRKALEEASHAGASAR